MIEMRYFRGYLPCPTYLYLRVQQMALWFGSKMNSADRVALLTCKLWER